MDGGGDGSDGLEELGRQWAAYLERKAAWFEDLMPQPGPTRSGRWPSRPCVAFGVAVDIAVDIAANRESFRPGGDRPPRLEVVSMSGDGYIPRQIKKYLTSEVRATLPDDVSLDAERRMIAFTDLAKLPPPAGEDEQHPLRGYRLESIAAGFKICYQCQLAMRQAGVRPASAVASPPPGYPAVFPAQKRGMGPSW
ncbi:hypothetical protein [Fodinicola acaciae]|uniref:hypothetical protein n=1 Tax=Fodinicola acaciae TaxID=2681555 RepID=UPI0013D880E5|nr:hypothetical protein [Fodinicola acaciae]